MTAPQAPTAVVPARQGNTVTLRWTAPPGTVTGYTVKRGSPTSLDVVGSTVTTQFVDAGVPVGEYVYAVAAVNSTGTSPDSDQAGVTISAPPITIAPGPLVLLVLVVLFVLAVIAVAVPFPNTPSTDTIAQVNGQVGAYLVRFGVILLVAAFVVALLQSILSSLTIAAAPAAPGTRDVGAGGLVDVISGLAKAFPELLKQPAGYGAVALLLGVVLLLGTAIGYGNSGA